MAALGAACSASESSSSSDSDSDDSSFSAAAVRTYVGNTSHSVRIGVYNYNASGLNRAVESTLLSTST